jgi:PAS domain S-box-containing protein
VKAFEGKSSGTFIREVKAGEQWYYQQLFLVPDTQRIRIYSIDITERKKAEEAVARQAELIDLSPDAIIIQQLDGAITFWSKGAEKLYGWTKDEALGQNIHTLLKTEFRQPLEEILNTVKLNGKWSGELVHNSKDGSKVAEQSYWLGKFGADGQIVEMLESNVDITERVELQVKLEESAIRVEEYANQMEDLAEKRAAQLKDAERLATIGATAGMVGHDIRNPLQAITGDVYLAKAELASIPESEEKNSALESLQEIEKNTDYINKIVQDLQDFARPLKPNIEEVDLKLVIEDLLKKNVLPENVKVSVKVESGARKIVADSTFVNRVMYNLVNNAVQAMPKGGKLTIHAYKEAKDVVITVRDTGVGIPEDVKSKLFTPMFTTKAKGQGFGLPVIKRMTEALGGAVTFESQEGKGTTFTVCFPFPKS